MAILEKIKEMKEKSKKRNFPQRYDVVVNIKDVDLKKPENKIDELLVLPKGTGKNVSITLFSDSIGKSEDLTIIKGSEIESLAKNKKSIKKLIKETDFFFSEPKLMPIVGKFLGKFLAPRGLMPKPVMSDIKKLLNDSKNSVRIHLDKQPIIHTVVGSDKMDDKDVEENIKTLLSFMVKKLPKGKSNIKNVYLKFTMGQPIKLEVE
jgi:large subunit ribosomal protein L1